MQCELFLVNLSLCTMYLNSEHSVRTILYYYKYALFNIYTFTSFWMLDIFVTKHIDLCLKYSVNDLIYRYATLATRSLLRFDSRFLKNCQLYLVAIILKSNKSMCILFLCYSSNFLDTPPISVFTRKSYIS